MLLILTVEIPLRPEHCNKKSGEEKQTQQQVTRGICLRGQTHWNVAATLPVGTIELSILFVVYFRSEEPSQVFLLTLTWLTTALGKESRDYWRAKLFLMTSFRQSQICRSQPLSPRYNTTLLMLSSDNFWLLKNVHVYIHNYTWMYKGLVGSFFN